MLTIAKTEQQTKSWTLIGQLTKVRTLALMPIMETRALIHDYLIAWFQIKTSSKCVDLKANYLTWL